MNISGIILVLFAAYLVFELGLGLGRGHAGGSESIPNRIKGIASIKSPYIHQYNELDDVDHVLTRPIMPGEKVTNDLVAFNTSLPQASGIMPSEASSSLVTVPASARLEPGPGPSPGPIEPLSQDIKALVEARQPPFLKEALIIDGKYYYDQRYPQRPVPIEFAKDPERYVREHPDEYPSYVIKSRMW